MLWRQNMPHRIASSPAGWLIILAIACAACSTTEPGSNGAGGLSLVTTTAGIQPDSDGYTIMVDGNPHGTVGSNDSVTLPDVERRGLRPPAYVDGAVIWMAPTDL
jgi:hypothetical protein